MLSKTLLKRGLPGLGIGRAPQIGPLAQKTLLYKAGFEACYTCNATCCLLQGLLVVGTPDVYRRIAVL